MSERDRSLVRAAQHASDWFAGLDDRPVAATASLDELRSRLARPTPEDPLDAERVIDDLAADTAGGLLGVSGARFFGWVVGGNHPAALAADWLVSAWDQNAAMVEASPAMAVIEETAGAWTLDLLGLPVDASYAFTTGCQLAHVTALAAARRQLLLQLGWDPEEAGLAGAPTIHVVAGEHGHHSIQRAVRLLGIGARQLHSVATSDNRTDATALAGCLRRLEGSPVIVCLSAGDINTGNFDDFATLVPACHERPNTWVHVDGAFGLWARVSPRFSHHLEGVELADSWATDGHKWLNTPFDVGFVATRHKDAHRNAMSVRASYLTHATEARDQIDWNPEWSRRARSAPVYAAIRALGRSGIAELVDRCCDAARELVDGIGALPGAEVVSVATTNQGLVRFLDPDGADHDHFTDSVIADLQAEGTAFFGGTTWGGMRAMRVSVCSWATTPADVERTIAAAGRVLEAARSAG